MFGDMTENQRTLTGLGLESSLWESLHQPAATATCNTFKTPATTGNCQRPVFSHKITNLWKFELNRSSKLRDYNERKSTIVTRSCMRLDG